MGLNGMRFYDDLFDSDNDEDFMKALVKTDVYIPRKSSFKSRKGVSLPAEELQQHDEDE